MSLEQKVKQTVYNTIKEIIKEISAIEEVEFDTECSEIIAELLYNKLISYGADLDAFQKHGKRSTITAEDVKLLVRNNESLVEIVEKRLQLLNSLKPAESKSLKRKKS